MDYRSLTSLAVRLAGVFILVSGITAMPNTFANLYAYGTRNDLTPGFLETLAPTVLAASGSIIIGLALIYFPSVVLNRVVAKDASAAEGPVVHQELQTLAFSVLGLYFACAGIFDAAYWGARGRLYYIFVDEAAAAFPRLPSIAPDEFGGLFAAALQVIVGAGLLLGARGLSGVVVRLRGRES